MEFFLNKLINYKDNKKFNNIIITIFGATLYSIGIKWFIIPTGQKTGGFTGIAQLLAPLLDFNPINKINYDTRVSILWFILNIPVFYLGFKGVGKRFTILSLISVFAGMISLAIMPIPQQLIVENIKNDLMLSAIAGGVITGIGVGITLKVGSSTGGMDIISQYLSYKRDGSFGQYSFVLNVIIISIVGFTESWLLALYTIINLFISILVIDKIHTRHNKLTLMIVTDYKDDLIAEIHKRIYRGITVIPAVGAYHRKDKSILFMVVSSYELYSIIATIKEIDKNAFTDVIKSQNVFGNFAKKRID